MRNIFAPLICVLFVSACAIAQKPTATAQPTPAELKLENIATITAISYSLKSLPERENSFKAKEDSFSIRLPRETELYRPAEFPQEGGMPKAGRVSWKMQEATIAISISSLPPGLIASWSSERYLEELKQTIEAAISNAKGKRVYEKEIKMGGLVAREAKLVAQGIILITRAFFANDRQYVLIAQLSNKEESENLVKTAFDTFELTNK